MKLMRRYYMKEFAKLLGVIAFGLALIFSLLDMIDKIDDFVPDRMSVLDFIHYAALNLPKYLYYLLPMSLLICSLFVFSQASRYKEIAVIKAAGGRLKGLFSQFILLGVLFSLFSFFLGEFVMPNFSERALDLRKRFMEGGEKLSFKEGTLWLRAKDGALVRMEIYIPDSNRARGVSIFMIDSSSLKKRSRGRGGVLGQEAGYKRHLEIKECNSLRSGRGDHHYNPGDGLSAA